jgi:hypothetical protein
VERRSAKQMSKKQRRKKRETVRQLKEAEKKMRNELGVWESGYSVASVYLARARISPTSNPAKRYETKAEPII